MCEVKKCEAAQKFDRECFAFIQLLSNAKCVTKSDVAEVVKHSPRFIAGVVNLFNKYVDNPKAILEHR